MVCNYQYTEIARKVLVVIVAHWKMQSQYIRQFLQYAELPTAAVCFSLCLVQEIMINTVYQWNRQRLIQDLKKTVVQ